MKWRTPRQALIEDDAHSIDIDCTPRGPTAGLLWRHVAWCAEKCARLRERGGALELDESEIDDARGQLRCKQDVRGLQVSVYNAVLVGMVQCAGKFAEECSGLGGAQGTILESIVETGPFHQFHGDIRQAVLHPDIEDPHDVRMR